MQAMRFRLAPLRILRVWIDQSISEKWPWGQLILNDFRDFPKLKDLWNQFLPLIDAAGEKEQETLLHTFELRSKVIVEEIDMASNKAALFDQASIGEIAN